MIEESTQRHGIMQPHRYQKLVPIFFLLPEVYWKWKCSFNCGRVVAFNILRKFPSITFLWKKYSPNCMCTIATQSIPDSSFLAWIIYLKSKFWFITFWCPHSNIVRANSSIYGEVSFIPVNDVRYKSVILVNTNKPVGKFQLSLRIIFRKLLSNADLIWMPPYFSSSYSIKWRHR